MISKEQMENETRIYYWSPAVDAEPNIELTLSLTERHSLAYSSQLITVGSVDLEFNRKTRFLTFWYSKELLFIYIALRCISTSAFDRNKSGQLVAGEMHRANWAAPSYPASIICISLI